MAAEQELGAGQTTSWYMGGLDRCSTAAFFLDLAPQFKEANTSKVAHLQF
jgi:hypothetical protein